MDIADIDIGARVEVYTPDTGTYWGFVTTAADGMVELDDVRPEGDRPTRVRAEDIVRLVSGVHR